MFTHGIAAKADPEGWGTGGLDPPLKNFKNIGLLSKSGPDPLIYQRSM